MSWLSFWKAEEGVVETAAYIRSFCSHLDDKVDAWTRCWDILRFEMLSFFFFAVFCCFCNKTVYCKPKHDLFLNLTKVFLCLNLSRFYKKWKSNKKQYKNKTFKQNWMFQHVVCRNIQCQHLFWRLGQWLVFLLVITPVIPTPPVFKEKASLRLSYST